MRCALDPQKSQPPSPKPAPVQIIPAPINVINQPELNPHVSVKEYNHKLGELQGKLYQLTRRLRKVKRSLTLVFEGPDAAGKGGTIRRLTEAMDARDYRVISVAAPTDE